VEADEGVFDAETVRRGDIVFSAISENKAPFGAQQQGRIMDKLHRRVLLASAVGSALEWYDFFIYGTAAALVFGDLFFPKLDAAVGTLAAFATFGVDSSRGRSAAWCSATSATGSAASRCW